MSSHRVLQIPRLFKSCGRVIIASPEETCTSLYEPGHYHVSQKALLGMRRVKTAKYVTRMGTNIRPHMKIWSKLSVSAGDYPELSLRL